MGDTLAVKDWTWDAEKALLFCGQTEPANQDALPRSDAGVANIKN